MDRSIETRTEGFDAELFNDCWRVVFRSDANEIPVDQEHIGAMYYPREGGVVIQLETRKEDSDIEIRKIYLSANELRFLSTEIRRVTPEEAV